MTTSNASGHISSGWEAWEKARHFLQRSRYIRVYILDTWPDSFLPEELACIQYPWEGPPADKNLAAKMQRAMVSRLRDAIQKEDIEIARVPVVVPVMELRPAIGRRSGGGVFRRSFDDSFGGVAQSNREVVIKPTIVDEIPGEIRTLARPAVAAWLRAGDVLPSAHVMAWLGPEWDASAPAPDKARKKPTEGTRSKKTGDRLRVAMEAGLKAYRKKHGTDPTASNLWAWLVDHDETGVIADSTDDKIVWITSKGLPKDISRKAFENRMTGIWANNPA